MHHPWRAFRHLVDWTLRWSHDLPDDIQGYVDHEEQEVVLAHGLTQAERRCTIAHETEHIRRGNVPDFYWPREERAIDDIVSRRLITLDALADALVWTTDVHQLAEELWVDVDTVKARLANLTEDEGLRLQARLDAAELTMPIFE
jgi:hypothetical protein